MDQKPFARLPVPRRVAQAGFPTELAEFYSQNEGVGLESTPDRLIRLCKLSEVTPMAWSDLHIIGDDPFEGWDRFSGLRLGISSFFDDIVYVINCPRCPAGAIMTLGMDIMGPAGNGPFPFECSLVLASSFSEWLQRLAAMQWLDYGLGPGELLQLPQPQQDEYYAYYKGLNPGIDWYQT